LIPIPDMPPVLLVSDYDDARNGLGNTNFSNIYASSPT
jgi:hypothetical protein